MHKTLFITAVLFETGDDVVILITYIIVKKTIKLVLLSIYI